MDADESTGLDTSFCGIRYVRAHQQLQGIFHLLGIHPFERYQADIASPAVFASFVQFLNELFDLFTQLPWSTHDDGIGCLSASRVKMGEFAVALSSSNMMVISGEMPSGMVTGRRLRRADSWDW